MRQIEVNMQDAIKQGRNWKESNTQVVCEVNGKYTSMFVYLHGNCIYEFTRNTENGKSETLYSLQGWNTPTTRSRLRALGIDIRQRGGVPYYKGKAISIREVYCAY